MKKFIILVLAGLLSLCTLTACNSGKTGENGGGKNPVVPSVPDERPDTGSGSSALTIPDVPQDIPTEYFSAASEQGTLVEIRYDTYESFS